MILVESFKDQTWPGWNSAVRIAQYQAERLDLDDERSSQLQTRDCKLKPASKLETPRTVPDLSKLGKFKQQISVFWESFCSLKKNNERWREAEVTMIFGSSAHCSQGWKLADKGGARKRRGDVEMKDWQVRSSGGACFKYPWGIITVLRLSFSPAFSWSKIANSGPWWKLRSDCLFIRILFYPRYTWADIRHSQQRCKLGFSMGPCPRRARKVSGPRQMVAQ